jgi:3-hydroxyisobutyrate dehydrogenase-like beta-hydroxyacid dehydrogenase
MRITVLGLGIIGSIWAKNWEADGHTVTTWNRTAKPDAPGWQPDLVDAVQDAELIALVLSDGSVTKQILEQVLPHAPADAIFAQHATIAQEETKNLAKIVQASGRGYLDMPFTGSKPAAEERQTVYFIGDDNHTYARVAETYESLSGHRFQCGGVGQAAAIKLCMNLIIAGTYQAMAEGLQLARQSGLSDELFFQVFDKNICRSGLADLKGDKMRQGDWAPQFSIKHLHKDLHLALNLGQTSGYLPPACQRIAQLYSDALAAGEGGLDFAAVMKYS